MQPDCTNQYDQADNKISLEAVEPFKLFAAVNIFKEKDIQACIKCSSTTGVVDKQFSVKFKPEIINDCPGNYCVRMDDGLIYVTFYQ